MTRVPVRLLVGAALAALAATEGRSAAGADAVKLRPGPAITVDGKGVALNHPEGVACTGSLLVVGDTGSGRFVLYDLADKIYTPKIDFQVAEIPVPIRVRIDAQGDILALDGRSRRIGRIGADGAFKGYVAVEAPGGATPVVRSFAVGADGALYVLDIAGKRILVGAADGKLSRQIALPADCGFPQDVAVDAAGKVYVIDSVGSRVFAAAKDQTTAAPITESLKDDMSFAASLAAGGNGELFVLDKDGGGIVILGTNGTFRGRQAEFGWNEGQLRWPSSLCVQAKGLAVADRENNRIATFAFAP